MFGFRKKAKPLVMPKPAWDGEHRLVDIRYEETMIYAGDPDIYTGYRWVCSCTAISRLAPEEWYDSEELAAQGHAKHRHVYENAKRHQWGPQPEYFKYQPHGHNG